MAAVPGSGARWRHSRCRQVFECGVVVEGMCSFCFVLLFWGVFWVAVVSVLLHVLHPERLAAERGAAFYKDPHQKLTG